MNSERTARMQPEYKTSGRRTNMDLKFSSQPSVARDEVYERRIFDLECYIEQLEHTLMMTECELIRCKRANCA